MWSAHIDQTPFLRSWCVPKDVSASLNTVAYACSAQDPFFVENHNVDLTLPLGVSTQLTANRRDIFLHFLGCLTLATLHLLHYAVQFY